MERDRFLRAAELLGLNAQALRSGHQRFDGGWAKEDEDLKRNAEDSEALAGELRSLAALKPAGEREVSTENRSMWTVGDWAKHVGAWESEAGHVCFGSWMALAAMLSQFQLEQVRQLNSNMPTVLAEVDRAMRKFPTWPTDPLHALAVLGEEYGELTQAVLQTTYEPHKSNTGDVRTEAVQVAAMALRFIASLDRYSYARCEQHEQVAA